LKSLNENQKLLIHILIHGSDQYTGVQEKMETVILMGPIGAGKSTQAELLSKELEQPRCSYDEAKSG
jgi:predicted Ser/Thr protein kinase